MVIGDGIIGAFGNAGLAAGAQVGVHDHNAVIALADSFVRATVGARRVVAMAAQIYLKTKRQFITDRPGAILGNGYQLDAVGRPVLLFAGHLTGS